MKPEMIELYKGVQGRRGEWRPFDNALDLRCLPPEKCIVYCLYTDISTVEMLYADRTYHATMSYNDPDLLWLPPVWSEDGRCLWKMVDWSMIKPYINFDGTMTIYRVGMGDTLIVRSATLPEALLRAIREQEDSHE